MLEITLTDDIDNSGSDTHSERELEMQRLIAIALNDASIVITDSALLRKKCKEVGVKTWTLLHLALYRFLKEEISENKFWATVRDLYNAYKKNDFVSMPENELSVFQEENFTTWSSWKRQLSRDVRKIIRQRSQANC